MSSSGALRTYDKLQGTPHSEWSDTDKAEHKSTDGKLADYKNIPGTVSHVGDEPYDGLTTERLRLTPAKFLSWEHKPTQREMSLKISSVSKAISAYMPSDAFGEYLNYFSQHLGEPQHQEMLQAAFKAINRQCRLNTPGYESPEYGVLSSEAVAQMIKDGNGNRLRDKTKGSLIKEHFTRYPELTTALAIFHAAHSSYLLDLYHALETTTSLSEDERSNGLYTIGTNSFNQFTSFLIFRTILPLAIFAYENPEQLRSVYPIDNSPLTTIEKPSAVLGKPTPLKVDHVRMQQAITTAWNIFFDKNLLMNQFNAEGRSVEPSEKPYAQMICPARNHLRAAMKLGAFERIYADIIARRDEPEVKLLINQSREVSETLQYR